MWIELSMPWIITLNVVTLPTTQLACAWLFTRLPTSWFDVPLPSTPPPRSHTSAFLKTWKRHLPDGAAWFAGGFHKRALASRNPDYLHRFITETRRGEACHWTAMLLCFISFSWNPWWGCGVIAGYAVTANLPCILLQRTNRRRFQHILSRNSQASNADAKSARS